MGIPIVGDDSGVITADIAFIHFGKELLDSGLRNVRRLLDSHGEASVSVIAKRSGNSTEILGRFVQLKCVEEHR